MSSLVLIIVLLLFSCFSSSVSADRGGIPLVPQIKVLEPGQKAIIAWNGKEEVLILSTDVKANQSTLILELLPLPSNPKAVEKANYTSFMKLQEIIQRHIGTYWKSRSSPDQAGQVRFEESVVVTFHEKIGAHDITVVKAENASELAVWINDFLRENSVTDGLSIEEYEAIFEDYISRGFPYFALDLVEVSPAEKSVEPILYRFETSFLYYPLKISTLFSGDTGITLFILTHHKVGDFIQYFRLGNQPWATSLVYVDENKTKAYAPANFTWSLGRVLQFNLTNDELREIDQRLESLFNGSALLTLLEYKGALDIFTGDLILREGEALVAYPFVPSLPFTYVVLEPPDITNLKVVSSNLITIKTLEEVRVEPPSHEFTVLVDYHSPVIGSVGYSILLDGSVSVQCQVEDSMSGVDEVTLFYQVEEEWKSDRMRRTDEGFVATIPMEPYENLSFYVEASDLAGNRAVEDNEAAYYLVDARFYIVSLIFRNVSLIAACILTAALTAFGAKVYVEKLKQVT
jgi:hypothetical protein